MYKLIINDKALSTFIVFSHVQIMTTKTLSYTTLQVQFQLPHINKFVIL